MRQTHNHQSTYVMDALLWREIRRMAPPTMPIDIGNFQNVTGNYHRAMNLHITNDVAREPDKQTRKGTRALVYEYGRREDSTTGKLLQQQINSGLGLVRGHQSNNTNCPQFDHFIADSYFGEDQLNLREKTFIYGAPLPRLL